MDLAGDFLSSLTAFTTTSSWSSSSMPRQISLKMSFSSPVTRTPSSTLTENNPGVSSVKFRLSSVPDPWSDLRLSASDFPMVFPGLVQKEVESGQ